MRQPGFYWVRDRLGWEVAKWELSWRNYEQWAVCGGELYKDDEDFEEIDERRIERQPVVDNSKCDIQTPTEEELRMMAEFNSLPLIEPNTDNNGLARTRYARRGK